MKLQIHRRLRGLLLLTTLATLAPSAARAQISSYWADPNSFLYQVSNMPDIDQFRIGDTQKGILGLPNAGRMYCIPTNTMNMLAYIANHGYPQVAPFPGDWSVSPPNSNYNEMTNWLFQFGVFIGTDPVKGSCGPLGPDTQTWLDYYAPGAFAVSWDTADKKHCPLLKDIARLAVQGSLIGVAIGFYDKYQTANGTKLYRNGGHGVTLVYAASADLGKFSKFGFNDPATDENGAFNGWVQQSAFRQETSDVEDVAGSYGYVDSKGVYHFWQRTQTCFHNDNTTSIDSYMAITPKYGLSASDSSIIIHNPSRLISLGNNNLDISPTRSVDVGGRVLDFAINPTSTQHPYLVDGVNAVMLIDTLTGQSSRLLDVNRPQHIAIGGQELYTFVVTPDQLIRVHPDGTTRAAVLRSPVDAIAFDEARARLVGVSFGEGKLRVFDGALNIIGNFALPAIDGDGSVDLGFCEGDGCLYLHRSGSKKVTRIAFTEGGRPIFVTIDLNCNGKIEGFFVDEKGNFFLACDGVVRAFTNRGTVLENSPLARMPAGSKLQILKPFSNYDPDYTDSPSFFNVDPARLIR